MTDLTTRILALFPPDGSTELSGTQIAKLERHDIWAIAVSPGVVYRTLRKLEADGKLIGAFFQRPRDRRYRLASSAEKPQNHHASWADQYLGSKAVMAARRTALIDEAVRKTRRLADYQINIVGTIYHHDVAQSTFEPFDTCHQCRKTIAAIRSEFAKLLEERG